jgi:hypothetical protein
MPGCCAKADSTNAATKCLRSYRRVLSLMGIMVLSAISICHRMMVSETPAASRHTCDHTNPEIGASMRARSNSLPRLQARLTPQLSIRRRSPRPREGVACLLRDLETYVSGQSGLVIDYAKGNWTI